MVVFLGCSLCATGTSHAIEDRCISRIVLIQDDDIKFHRIFRYSEHEIINSFYYFTGLSLKDITVSVCDEDEANKHNIKYWNQLIKLITDENVIYTNLSEYYFNLLPPLVQKKAINFAELFALEESGKKKIYFNIKELKQELLHIYSTRYFTDTLENTQAMSFLYHEYQNLTEKQRVSKLSLARDNGSTRKYIPLPFIKNICLSPFNSELCICKSSPDNGETPEI